MFKKLTLILMLNLLICNSVFAGSGSNATWGDTIRWCTRGVCKVVGYGLGFSFFFLSQLQTATAGNADLKHEDCRCLGRYVEDNITYDFCGKWRCDLNVDCFCGEGKVTVKGNGGKEEFKNMEDLRVGDYVKVGTHADGTSVFDEIYYIPHANKDKNAKFLKISADDDSVFITGNHLLFIAESPESKLRLDHSTKTVKARDLKVGDRIFLQGKPVLVTSIEEEVKKGVFAPVTKNTGMLEVDGVAASSYSTVNKPTLVSWAYWIRSKLFGTDSSQAEARWYESLIISGVTMIVD